jgi:DNA-binding NarL/FixJ family response regulator
MNLVLKQKPDIIIVDDHVIFRQGLKAIINFEDIGTVIGEVSDGDEFIELLSTLKPDVVLTMVRYKKDIIKRQFCPNS